MYMHREHIICNTEYSENICQALSAASLSTIKIDPSYDILNINKTSTWYPNQFYWFQVGCCTWQTISWTSLD